MSGALPPKKKKEGDRFMRRREKFLTRFLQALCRCDEFKSDPFFVEWLKNDDVKAFEKMKIKGKQAGAAKEADAAA